MVLANIRTVAVITAMVGVAVGAALYEGHPPFRNWVDEQFERHAQAMRADSGYNSDDEKERDARHWELRRYPSDDDGENYDSHRSHPFSEKDDRSRNSSRNRSSRTPSFQAVTSGVDVVPAATGLRQRTQGAAGFTAGSSFADPFSDEASVLYDREAEREMSPTPRGDRTSERTVIMGESTSRVADHEDEQGLRPPTPPPRPSRTLSAVSAVSTVDGIPQSEITASFNRRLNSLDAMVDSASTVSESVNSWHDATSVAEEPPALPERPTSAASEVPSVVHSMHQIALNEASSTADASSSDKSTMHSPMSNPASLHSFVGWTPRDDTADSVISTPSYDFVDEDEVASQVSIPRQVPFLPLAASQFPPHPPSDAGWVEFDRASTASWDSIDSEESFGDNVHPAA